MWRKERDEAPVQKALRTFNMDMKGEAKWEWVGPKVAILVYGVDKPTKADGSVLFGNYTWGQTWENGYEPLAVLDKDEDGRVSGAELETLWLWIDRNSNAKIDELEVLPAKEKVQEIKTAYETDKHGNTWQEGGATLIDGMKIRTWDWWSMPEN
jgi:hypothetical protein